MNRMKIVALVFASVGVLTAGAAGLARQVPNPQEKGKPAEVRPAEKEATEAVKPNAAEEERVVAQTNLLNNMIEEDLRLDLVRTELDWWKDKIHSSFESRFGMERRLPSRSRKTNMTDEESKEVIENHFDQIQVADREEQEAKRKYEDLIRDIVRRERGLREMEEKLSPPVRDEFDRWKSDSKRLRQARPASDVEHRLSNVERKLDLILNALEGRSREPGK